MDTTTLRCSCMRPLRTKKEQTLGHCKSCQSLNAALTRLMGYPPVRIVR